MLETDRAIAYLQEHSCKAETSFQGVHLCNIAINALKKSSPMLVNHKRTFWYYAHYCPSCSNLLESESMRHCSYCGQCLDWSNYEMGLKYVR